MLLSGCSPQAYDDRVTIDFNETISIDVVENDRFSEKISEFTQGTLGTVTKGEKHHLIYTPNKNVYGKDSFEYTVTDEEGNQRDSAKVFVTINPPRAIDVNDDNGSCVEDESLKIDFILDNDKTDVIGPLEIVDFADFKNGKVEKLNGSYFFVPDKDFNGDGGFTYRVKDALDRIGTGFVSIEVTSAPDSPIALDDKAEAYNDETVEIDVLENDTDIDGDNINIVKVFDYYNDGRTHLGTMEIKNNKLYYTPYKGKIGIDKFKYAIKDDSGLEATGIVTVGVISRGKTLKKTIHVNEDDYVNFSLAGYSAYMKDYPHKGNVKFINSRVRYTPLQNFNGEDFFTFYYRNNNNGTDYMKVKVIVNPVNDAPIAVDDEYLVEINSMDNILNVLSNDIDVDGDIPTIESIGIANNGVATIRENKIVYNPSKDFQGKDTLAYTISDARGETSTATINISVKPVNHDPIALDDEFTIQEDSLEREFDVLNNDSDIDNDNLTIEKINTIKYGSVLIKNNKVLYYPKKDFYGKDIITYTINDGKEGRATATITVIVNPVNDNPVAVDDNFIVDEDSVDNVFDVLNNDIEKDNDIITITSIVGTSNGSYRVEGNKIIYSPVQNFNGNDVIKYYVADGKGGTAEATINITVNSVNDVPVAMDDVFAVEENSVDNVFDVLSNDTDVDGDSLEIESIAAGEHGTVRIENNRLIYTPTSSFSGQDTLSYTINDGNGETSTAIISVIVNSTYNPPPVTNNKPVAVDDSFEVEANSEGNEFDVLINDSDVDGDALTISSVGNPQHGIATIVSKKIIYCPEEGYKEDTFTYTISDGRGGTATGTIIVTVSSLNNNPIAMDDEFSVEVGSAANEFDVLGNDSDEDGDTLTISSVGTPQHGTAVIVSNKIKYTPNEEYSGEDSITYTISDGEGGTATATVTIIVKVIPVNNNPVAVDDNFEVEANSEDNEFNVLNNDSDVDGDTLTISSVETPQHGIATIVSNKISYSPNEEYSGEDTFTYIISDGKGGTATAHTTVTVNPHNNPPVAVNDIMNITYPPDDIGYVLVNDYDHENDPFSITSFTQGRFGTVSRDSNRFIYEPGDDFERNDTFTYTISDAWGRTSTATVTVTNIDVDD